MRFATLALVALLVSSSVAAQEHVILGPIQDTSIYEESGDLANGAGSYLFAGTTALDKERRALVQFDFASIPVSATVTNATLALHMSRTIVAGEEVSIHRVLQGWGEGASDATANEGTGASATSGDATWTHRLFDTTAWATGGGDFEPTATASVVVDQVGIYEWSSAGTIADVQSWVDGTHENDGWILVGGSGLKSAKRFDSRENSSPGFRPTLTVTYTTGTSVEDTPALAAPALSQNYPNPFMSDTEVAFTLPARSDVTLEVFDLLGRRVATLVDGNLDAGVHSVSFRAGRAPTGIYLARLRVGDLVVTRQMARIE